MNVYSVVFHDQDYAWRQAGGKRLVRSLFLSKDHSALLDCGVGVLLIYMFKPHINPLRFSRHTVVRPLEVSHDLSPKCRGSIDRVAGQFATGSAMEWRIIADGYITRKMIRTIYML